MWPPLLASRPLARCEVQQVLSLFALELCCLAVEPPPTCAACPGATPAVVGEQLAQVVHVDLPIETSVDLDYSREGFSTAMDCFKASNGRRWYFLSAVRLFPEKFLVAPVSLWYHALYS